MSRFCHLTLLLALAAVGCVPEIQYTVTNVYMRNGQLYQQKCPLTPGGRVATNDPSMPCHDEPVMVTPGTGQVGPPSTVTESAAPPGPAVPAPAPIASALVTFFNSSSVHSDVDGCRQQYANGVKLFRFKVTVEPTGDVTAAEPIDHAGQWFEDCAVKALRAAKVPPFTSAGAVITDIVLSF
jgi:hypothetical protein